ncbi:MAG: IS3 family transposase [Rhodocyclaceae bacterium]|nr:IS3 family transposase [Rhodocyclaceae bacterium]
MAARGPAGVAAGKGRGKPGGKRAYRVGALEGGKRKAEDGRRNPKKSGGVLRQGKPVKYAWIDKHDEQYSVARMCELLEVSASGYYDWRGRPPCPRSVEDERITAAMRASFARHRGNYGRPRLTQELRAQGYSVNHKRVRRLMLREGLASKRRRRFVRTTDSNHEMPVAANLLNQEFVASRPNEVWLADITYVETDEGWLYVALILDLFSRRLVGWAMSAHIDHTLVTAALALALGQRQPAPGLVHHSDRGSQYCAERYQSLLASRNVTLSMSRRGNCYDNAPMESVNGTLKVERVHREHYATRREAIDNLIEYIG